MRRTIHAAGRRSIPYSFSAVLFVTGAALIAARSPAAPRREDRREAGAGASAGAQRTSSSEPRTQKNKKRDRLQERAQKPACPSSMKLVSGDYCTDVEQKCTKSWYDASNKKTICERFDARVRCKGKTVPKRFCMDTYEWPNAKGKRPEVMNRFHQAQVKCAAIGKRLCTETEWTLACEGPKRMPFPYGFERDTGKCHGDVPWDDPNMSKVAERDPAELARLWRGVRSGTQRECVSAYGVADLPGNADEVVASETFGAGWRGKYDSVHTGGPWYQGVRNQCRPKIYTHDEGFYYYFLSFRCCAEADGKPTDPRTPKQIKAGWSMKTVERKAGFTIAEMQEKFELRRRKKCTCPRQDVLCKTMCGTLLGPNARDAK
jgi:hypothetical protein